MMVSHTLNGVVFGKHAGCLTIILPSGSKRKVKVNATTLKLGDKVHVAIDCSTNKITDVWAVGDPSPDSVVDFPDDLEITPREWECSRRQWEEDLENGSVLGVQSFEGVEPISGD